MTGIERLRDIVDDGPYSGGMIHISVQKLREICEQIEAEADVETARWVREHGGLDAVRTSCGHADNRRVELCAALGIDTDTGWSDAMAEMVKRLMPEGMSWLLEVWPKWSNGEYCKFGDWWTADKYGDYEPRQLRRLVFYTPEQLREWEQDEGDNFGYEWDFMRPSDTTYRPDKAEPPAPKALDANGAEIRVGDSVWGFQSAIEYVVDGFVIDGSHGAYTVKAHYADGLELAYLMPNKITHRAPVLAADGKPLREGETVWDVSSSIEFTVIGLPRSVGYQAVKLRLDDGAVTGLDPDRLTHERPESWERLEDDATMPAATYCERMGIEVEEGHSFVEPMARDLVRRCKAFAERDR